MTPTDLAAKIEELERLEKAATPGKWASSATGIYSPGSAHTMISADGNAIFSNRGMTKGMPEFNEDGVDSYYIDRQGVNDLEYVAALHNDALPIIRELRTQLVAKEKECKDWKDGSDVEAFHGDEAREEAGQLRGALHDHEKMLAAEVERRERTEKERDALRNWKTSAMNVLAEWDTAWEAAGRPGKLGSSKAAATTSEIATLKRQLAEPERPAEGQYFCLGGCHNTVSHKLKMCNSCTSKQAQIN